MLGVGWKGIGPGAAGSVVKISGYGLIGDVIVGVIGSFIGGWLFDRLGVVHGAGFLGALIGATVGAVILLFLVRLVRRAASGRALGVRSGNPGVP